MEEVNKNNIFNLFVLKNIFENLMGVHYPFEIIIIIIKSVQPKILISSGDQFTFVSIDGTGYTWGKNNKGQLGLGYCQDKIIPQKINLKDISTIACQDHYCLAVNKMNEMYQWGDMNHELRDHFKSVYLPTKINLPNIVKIFSG